MEDVNVEVKKPERKSKVEKYFFNGLEFIEKKIKNDRADGIFISEITCCNNKYKAEIVYNEDRAKFQAWISMDDRRMSLSFFTLARIAKDNILKTICYWNGVNDQGNNAVGD